MDNHAPLSDGFLKEDKLQVKSAAVSQKIACQVHYSCSASRKSLEKNDAQKYGVYFWRLYML